MSPTKPSAVPRASDQSRIERELIELSWQRYASSTLIPPAAALALGAIVLDHVEPVGLAVWGAWVVFAYVWRALAFRKWSRQPIAAADLSAARRDFVLLNAATGLIWGSAALLFLIQLDPLRQALVVMLICGIAGGSAQSGAGLRAVILVNIALELLPVAGAALIIGGWLYGLMAACLMLYAIYLLRTGFDQHRWLREHLNLQAENEALVARLETALIQANAANETKTQFLANMSHELRTPLNAIIGFADMIASMPEARMTPAKYQDYGRAVLESGRHLLALIGDLLDLTKAEAGRLELEEEACDLGAILTGCIDQLRPVAASQSLTLASDFAARGPSLRADAVKLRQIAFNLLSNAIKFTPPGGTVTVAVPPLDDSGRIVFRVSDTGVGMAPEEVPRALEPFGQIRDPYAKSQAGTGLGLPLTKRLVELHGGRLDIASAKGEGTIVTVALPTGRFLGRGPKSEADVAA